MSFTSDLIYSMNRFQGVPYVYGGPRSSMDAALTGTDCSGAVIAATEAAVTGASGGASYTGDMRERYLGTGLFAWQDGTAGLTAGDILLYDRKHPGHTAVWDGSSILEEYPPQGRRTGFYQYDGAWDGYLRYIGGNGSSEYYGTGGTYRVTDAASPYLNVRTAPSLSAECVAKYYPGETVVLEGLRTVADGYVWGSYIGATSGETRYVAIAAEDATEVYLELA